MNSFLPLTLGDDNISPYAGFWRRAGAIIVDLLILAPYGFLVFYLQKSQLPRFLAGPSLRYSI